MLGIEYKGDDEMEVFNEYLEKIEDLNSRERLRGILQWINDSYPNLDKRIAWNQPMFTSEGTFIIGFSLAKNHISIAPEKKALEYFLEDIVRAGYSNGNQIFRIGFDMEVDYELLARIIEFNIEDKKDYTSFWRK